jgi:hypothetical protein
MEDNTIIRVVKQELDDNHFDTQMVKNSWARESIRVRNDDITRYIVLLDNGFLSIYKGHNNTNTGQFVFKAPIEHPKSIGAILSYLHRNCEFGRDIRNHLGFNPHRGPGEPSPEPQEKIGPETAQPTES